MVMGSCAESGLHHGMSRGLTQTESTQLVLATFSKWKHQGLERMKNLFMITELGNHGDHTTFSWNLRVYNVFLEGINYKGWCIK